MPGCDACASSENAKGRETIVRIAISIIAVLLLAGCGSGVRMGGVANSAVPVFNLPATEWTRVVSRDS